MRAVGLGRKFTKRAPVLHSIIVIAKDLLDLQDKLNF